MKVNMKKIESLMILRGVNVTELMQAAGLERATYYYIKKKGGTSPRTLKAIAKKSEHRWAKTGFAKS